MKTTGRFLTSSYRCFVGRQITFTLLTFTFFTLAQCDRPCLNGGFCASRNHCQCRSGFHGDQCEKGQDDYFIEFTTVYHLQGFSGNSVWKYCSGCFGEKFSRVTERPVFLVGIETLRSNDADGDENVTKTIGFITKTTPLHVYHARLYISLPVFARLRRENA